ncbi:heme ABC exporter ATP-binding protein CcmA [Metabacillus niabensis]|uniref:ABC-2 type transport system ATP-binding protein n=1 Tax=Metabacillus niabensis TaxID=324854 RepID=A0ABT9YW90_9BACI|nr:heme ABC exporter ATP-binding protein CcmA [Metabacillus niabensis]MDQ0223866.1 ABC-2 type transport system ATP-binding protein [Metabacillus niabensis]
MITIDQVHHNYGKKKILQGVSLQINAGEIFGLLGPNGAGKSTLLSILTTTVKPSKGTVTMKGLDIHKQTKQVRQMIGYVPQDIALWDELTVKENLKFWSKFLKTKVSVARMLEACEEVKLQDKWNEKLSKLSGGMKRKLNIAVALMHDPDILLMDEPTVGIDLQSKLEINEYMKSLAAAGKTIVYTTHDMSEIKTICKRIGVLKKGGIEFTGTLEEAKSYLNKQGNEPIVNEEELIFAMLREER